MTLKVQKRKVENVMLLEVSFKDIECCNLNPTIISGIYATR